MPSLRTRVSILLASLLLATPLLAQNQSPKETPDSCLLFATRNISKGSANFYLYCTFSKKKLVLQKGDVLEYDLYTSPNNPIHDGGIDIEFSDGNLRDSELTDQQSIEIHPGTDLESAVGKWYHRSCDLSTLAGKKTREFRVVEEGDSPGLYVQFIANVEITHADGKKDWIYRHGNPSVAAVAMKEGYSQHFILKSVDRAKVTDGANAASFDAEVKHLELSAQLDHLRTEVELAHKIATRANDPHLQQHVDDANKMIAAAEANDALDAEAVQSLIHTVHNSLNHEHPLMQQYTGHLVGHAHIDFQWLWEWPETVQVCHDTFNQAVKFMAEFPGFKFSQSSTALYATTEEHFPDVFKRMQEEVAKGNWELVGGRVCEGDENMISPESHAMHFLYGQRYFRERFNGKMATVGWEPDTFGHTWQFPQILQLGGCKYFYFCRGGYNIPMFWWQAPDGSKVLAFEEPATGGWYNGDVTTNRFDRLFNFEDKTGVKEMLWVYGVGNHGGGPTRENINAALDFQKQAFLPKVKFSTATEFFNDLAKYDLSKIPTHNGDMNTTSNAGFFGVFTTHSDIKKWNRDAEATTESAEAIAALASLYGFDYPQKEFRKNWEDICWNHHHDTLPGTSIHPSYNRSEAMFKRVMESSRKISDEALAYLGTMIKNESDATLVFNPTGLTRSGIIELNDQKPGTFMSDGKNYYHVGQSGSGKPFIFVKGIPPYGYLSLTPNAVQVKKNPDVKISKDLTTIENGDYRVVLDPNRGVVTSVYDKKNNFEGIAAGGSGNRLVVDYEKPNGMSAWSIGEIQKIETLTSPVTFKLSTTGDSRQVVSWDRKYQNTTIHQYVALNSFGPPEFGYATEWKELGAADKPCPFLKVAFDINCSDKAVETLQIPYGTIEKPNDNVERGAREFVDLSDSDGGAAIINDCKHGYSATGHTLRLSLIRSSYYPDPHPNDRPQSAKWLFVPHTGKPDNTKLIDLAEAFNHPLWSTPVKANPNGSLPPEGSLVSIDAKNVVITGVKRAEDDNSLVVRFYEAAGQPTLAKLALPFEPRKVETVNFIEDKLADESSASIQLRGHEIRTLKISK